MKKKKYIGDDSTYTQDMVTTTATASLFLLILSSGNLRAQDSPPPPPSPRPSDQETKQPDPTPPPGDYELDAKVKASAERQPVILSEEEREVLESLALGNRAVIDLDPKTAQLYFEQAFSKCDEHGIVGSLLARVYMAIGALYAGYLKKVPEGIELMKVALSTDPKAVPDKELVNEQVIASLNTAREQVGLLMPKAPAAAGGIGFVGLWVMKHDRLSQAKRMYPFGIHVETNQMVAIKEVRLYFRFPSDSRFQMVEMPKKKNLYGTMIECYSIALLDPKAFYYYIEVVGGDGSIIAQAGELENPIEVKLLKEDEFQGDQPTLPWAYEPSKCNPDQVAPCPPWDPHCKDTPCVANDDCLPGNVCTEGYCTSSGQDETQKPIGIVISGGLGMGAGIAVGDEEGILSRKAGEIPLEGGFSPSWIHTRLMAGYFILDNLLIGVFVRFQHIRKDQWLDVNDADRVVQDNHHMKISGMMLSDRKGYPDNWRGPMWGPTVSFFLWSNKEWFGPGQILNSNNELADDQGFKVYGRFEFDIFGAMYHEVTISEKDRRPEAKEGDVIEVRRQHVSGMEGLGLGAGALFGVHKHINLGAELMYDFLFPDIGHNFDLQLQAQFHF
ncbi:MAG: hypothetical protein GY847_11605 [Proteobacteria bacterium]|nr:hypothetical protein [Pseudomonadota bacterium]